MKPSDSLWKYLEKSGVLETGDQDQIVAAKQLYRKKYLSEYKRKHRSENQECTVMLSKLNDEFQVLYNAASKHHMTLSQFLKQAAMAYTKQKYLIPDTTVVSHLQQLLSECLNEIRSMNKEIVDSNSIKIIEQRIAMLEDTIENTLTNPKLIESDDSKA